MTPAGERKQLDPRVISEWQKIFRDTMITILAAFILVFEVAFRPEPNAYALGAALAMLGVPPALRLDQARRSKKPANGGGANTEEDPYEGPGGYFKT